MHSLALCHPPRLKVEVEAHSLAGAGPTAGRLELAAGNGRDHVAVIVCLQIFHKIMGCSLQIVLLTKAASLSN